MTFPRKLSEHLTTLNDLEKKLNKLKKVEHIWSLNRWPFPESFRSI